MVIAEDQTGAGVNLDVVPQSNRGVERHRLLHLLVVQLVDEIVGRLRAEQAGAGFAGDDPGVVLVGEADREIGPERVVLVARRGDVGDLGSPGCAAGDERAHKPETRKPHSSSAHPRAEHRGAMDLSPALSSRTRERYPRLERSVKEMPGKTRGRRVALEPSARYSASPRPSSLFST